MSIRAFVIAVGVCCGFSLLAGATESFRIVSTGEEARVTFAALAQKTEKQACLPGWAVQTDALTCIQDSTDEENARFTCYAPVEEDATDPRPVDFRQFCMNPSTIGVGNID